MRLKILQINRGKGRAAQDLAFLTVEQEIPDIIVVAEPNQMVSKGTRAKEWTLQSSTEIRIRWLGGMRNPKVTLV